MFELETPLKLTPAAMRATNLTDQLSEDDLARLGDFCFEGYSRDEQSRTRWLERNEVGMDLALQIQKEKSFPWEGCSNVAFPLVTIAAMQFHARAYPTIVSGEQIVRSQVWGDDPTGELTARADRIGAHMSWQLFHEDRAWEEQEDKALLNLSIVGTNFKKSYRSPSVGHNVSELVLAKDLVVNYWAKSLETAARLTHKIPRYRNEVRENVLRGVWRDVLEMPWYASNSLPTGSSTQTAQDNRQGIAPSQADNTTSLLFLEQHCDLDLDADGYAEPYIITFEAVSKCVVRIVTNFDGEASIERVAGGARKGQIVKITSTAYFTKNTFIPSPDGGFYDIGFGVFLGPLNEAVNSIVNMLLDAGTLQSTAGGFLARGAKIRGGTHTFSPFEWKRVESSGDDLRKSVYPLPVNAPSDVLFQMLSLLINYTSRISGTVDIMVGENPGQNTPAQTTQTMVEMGQKIYTAIFKRVWRAKAEEFQKLYNLNARFLPLDVQQPGGATRSDYQGNADAIRPVADPNVSSETMRIQIAERLKMAAANTPGYDKDEVERRYLKALRVEGIDTVFKGTEGQPPPKDPNLTLIETKVQGDLAGKKLDAEVKQQALQLKLQEQQVELQKFLAELEEERRVNNAKIAELMAKAAEAAANAQSEQAYAQVALVNAEISKMQVRNTQLNTRIEHLLKIAELEIERNGNAKSSD